MARKKFIKGTIKKPGALRKTAGVKKGQKIPVSTLRRLAKKPGKTGQRARFALTLRKMNRGRTRKSSRTRTRARSSSRRRRR